MGTISTNPLITTEKITGLLYTSSPDIAPLINIYTTYIKQPIVNALSAGTTKKQYHTSSDSALPSHNSEDTSSTITISRSTTFSTTTISPLLSSTLTTPNDS